MSAISLNEKIDTNNHSSLHNIRNIIQLSSPAGSQNSTNDSNVEKMTVDPAETANELPRAKILFVPCTNPLCLQCQYTTPQLLPNPHSTTYPVTFPLQYYYALANNGIYPQSPLVPPSAVFIPSTPFHPEQQALKNEISPADLKFIATHETKADCIECIAQTNQKTKMRRRKKSKATIGSFENQPMTRLGEIYRCSNCGVSETPAWRRDLQGEALLCNACGLYLKVKKRPRPTKVNEDGEIRLVRPAKAGSKCQNCGAVETPYWRGSEMRLCNRCGLFLKQHGHHRSESKV